MENKKLNETENKDKDYIVPESEIVFKNINMMCFEFDTYNDDSKYTPNFKDIESDFQNLIDKTLENRIVYVNIDYCSFGGDIIVLSALYNRIKQLTILNVQVNINVVGDLASCGVYLLLLLAKEKLCTFTFSPILEPSYLIHEGYMRVFTNNIKREDKLEHHCMYTIKKMNENLLSLVQEFVTLSKTEISKFKKGVDIFIKHKDLYMALEERNLIQKEFPIKADVIEIEKTEK